MRRTTACLLTAALSLAAAGCSSGDEDPPSSSPTTGSSAPSSSKESGAGVEEFDPKKILVEQTLVAVDDPRSNVKIAVTALQVQDRVMRLELAVTPQRATLSATERQSVFDLRLYFDNPALVDRGNLKRYDVLSAGPGKSYESDPVETKTVNGRAMRVYYYYAAPQDDIDKIDVVVSDSYPAFTDVPISR